MTTQSIIDETDPANALAVLEATDDSVLIDVRTDAEWEQVGVPDISATGRRLWFIEWVKGADRTLNTAFLDEVVAHAGPRSTLR